MASRILYLAVGENNAVHTQARYAALSAVAWGGDAQVMVFTDQPQHYASIADCVSLHAPPQELVALTLPESFDPFQLKLGLLHYAAIHYAADCLLFCDADTFFLQPPTAVFGRIADRAFCLHRREYALDWHRAAQTRRFCNALRRAGIAADAGTMFMWNSGVVGLPAGSGAVIARARSMFEKLVPHTSKRYLAEQFSISQAIAQAGTVLAAEEFVFHYWFQKGDYTRAVEERMATTPSRDELLAAIRDKPLRLPAPPQKLHWWEHLLIRARLRIRPEDIRGLPK
jgi:hypothetical protein